MRKLKSLNNIPERLSMSRPESLTNPVIYDGVNGCSGQVNQGVTKKQHISLGNKDSLKPPAVKRAKVAPAEP